MFVMLKKKRTSKFEVISKAISASVRLRSIKPLTWLFRKGRFGMAHQLEGNLFQYAEYCDRTNRRLGIYVVGK